MKDWTRSGASEQPVSFSGDRIGRWVYNVSARKIDFYQFSARRRAKGRRRLGFLRFAIRPVRPC